jgi:hypothetical protein
MFLDDGWYRLPSGAAVLVMYGEPVRVMDGGQLELLAPDERADGEVRILAEVARALGRDVRVVGGFEVGTTASVAVATVVVASSWGMDTYG